MRRKNLDFYVLREVVVGQLQVTRGVDEDKWWQLGADATRRLGAGVRWGRMEASGR